MLISTCQRYERSQPGGGFQSLDWVDVDFDFALPLGRNQLAQGFNPSTGLMLISTAIAVPV